MKKPPEFVEFLHEVFHRFGTVHSRPMFGGYGIYHQGVMIGLVASDVLYLKTDAQTAARFAEAGCRPFEYSKNGVVMQMSYASAPVQIFDDPDAARVWAGLAYQAALRSRNKTARRSATRRATPKPTQAAPR